jgi:uncharacterized SAM-binding protein YcdF (DUF218 family)
MSTRWLLWALLSPSQVLLAVLIVGAVLLALGRLRSGRLLVSLGGAGLVLFGLLPTSIYLANPLETRFPQPALPAQITGIVLLSGAERPAASEAYGEPQVGGSGGRYLTTLRLATRYPGARIVFTGGPSVQAGKGALETQTAVAAEILGTVGLDPTRLTIEEQSGDTCANASNTFRLVKPQPGESWVVVTSALHMPRTIACFRAAGWPEVIPHPADYQTVLGGWNVGSIQIARNLLLLDAAVHEWLGLAHYRLTGRTQELFPGP